MSTKKGYARRVVQSMLAGTILAVGGVAISAHAQDALAPADVEESDAIVVTGLRGLSSKTAVDSPAPIDIVPADRLTGTGRQEVGEALARTLPSINFGRTGAGVASIVRPIFNRSLPPAYTLILVDGKRRHNSALLTNGGGDTSGFGPVDLDFIPIAGVRSVEVLKDSAAAQYGSDAVAGVINFVLHDRPQPNHVSVTYGDHYKSYGDPWSAKVEGAMGFELGDGGYVNLSGDVRGRGMSWRGFAATNRILYAPASNPKNAEWDGIGAHNGDPRIRAFNLGLNAALPAGNVTLYMQSTVGRRKAEIGNMIRRPNGTASFSTVFPDGYFPVNNTSETDFQLLGGVKGDLSGWRWEFSSSYGRNQVRMYSDLTINPSLGPTGPISFDNLGRFRFSQWTNNLDVSKDLDIGLAEPLHIQWGLEGRREIFQTFAGDPRGYTNGGYIIRAGDQEGDANVGRIASIGAQGAITLSPRDEAHVSRNVFAGYVDLGLTITPRWYVDIAGRAEHYGLGAGSTVGGKVNSRYELSTWLAVRGTVGTGFRAPSLSQVGYAQTDNRTATSPTTGLLVAATTQTAPTTSALATALGAKPLKPESTWNLGLGLALRPARNLSLTIDGYQINIDDRIARTASLSGPALNPIFAANGVAPGTFVQYFANAADTRTRGVDIVGYYTADLATLGELSLSAAYTYSRTKIRRVAITPAVLAGLGPNPGGSLMAFGNVFRGEIADNQPRSKLALGGKWSLNPVAVDLRVTRYGKYRFLRTENAAQNLSYDGRWIADLEVALAVTSRLGVAVGATNLFSTRPDNSGVNEPTSGVTLFNYGNAPFDSSGGFYYGRINFSF
ncbi:MAG: TonB-dependent receptor plug domain-containing protein [Sphingobium sp.]